mgnify:CR=1 FL=1
MILSDGRATSDITSHKHATNVSQASFAIDFQSHSVKQLLKETVDRLVRNFNDAPPPEVRYPSEGIVATRRDNMEHGTPVDPDLRQQVFEL